MQDQKRAEKGKPYANDVAVRWALSLPGCKGHRRSTLIQLAKHVDPYGCCFPSSKTLAAAMGISGRTVQRCMADLEGEDLIRRIGRKGKHGGQISNVVVLVGWPERKRLPRSGHPALGPTVKESLSSLLQQMAQARTEFRPPPDTVSDQNKGKEQNTTTDPDEAWKTDPLLRTCFRALGPWANEANRAFLWTDRRRLEQFLKEGADLRLHVLPALHRVAHRRKVPELRTWEYFASMIEAEKHRTWKRQNTARIEAPVTSGASSVPKQPKQACDDLHANQRPAMEAFLKRALKKIG